MTADPQRPSPPFDTLAFAVAFVGLMLVVALTIGFQLAPQEVRVWNLSAVGAVAIFTAARVGLVHGFAFAAAAIVFKDLCLYLLTDWWEPYPSSWLYFAGYALAGWYFLRQSHSVGRIFGTVLGTSLAFFVVSNFESWLRQSLPYGYSLDGLRNCYVAGIPFYRGTLLGDVLFTAAFFGAHAVLARLYRPQELVPVANADKESW